MIAAAGVQEVVAAFAVERAIAPSHEDGHVVVGNFYPDSCRQRPTMQCVHGVGVDEVIHIAGAANVEQHDDAIWAEFLFLEGELDCFANAPVAATCTPGRSVAGKVERTWLIIYHSAPVQQ